MRTVVTGAWSYSGRWIAAALLDAGHSVVSLTKRPTPNPDPHGGRVRRIPYTDDPAELALALDGAEALHCGYWVRPIHLEDYAAAVVAALEASDSWTRDATGPDRIEFGDLIRLLASITGGGGRPARLPLALCHLAYAATSRASAETILTVDELKGLSRNLLDSTAPPMGQTSLLTWLRAHAHEIGARFVREPPR